MNKNNSENTALLVGDLHLRRDYLEFGKILLLFVLETIKAKKPKYTIFMGDQFHFKDRISGICVKVYNDFLIEASKHTKIIILVGNHDWCQPYTIHSMESFKNIPNVKVVDDFFRLDNDNLFISYCREKERFNDLLKQAGPCKRLFGHLDINSFKVGSGWEEVEAFCDPDFFSDQQIKEVYSGHLHLAQEQTVKGTRITFVGTGYTTDFGETDQSKRLILLNLDDSSYESIDTGLTFHKTLKINAGDQFPEVPVEEMEKGIEYRLIIKGTKEQISMIQKPKNYYIKKIVYDWVLNEGARMDLSVIDSKDTIMKKYIEQEIKRSFNDDPSFNKEELFKIGNRILNSVK